MQLLIVEIENLRGQLKNTLSDLNKAGYNRAKAEHDYRIALAKEILIQRDKGLPVTIINDVCKGNLLIARLKLGRDITETEYETTLEKLRAIKIELGIVERQIEAIRRGE